MTDKAHGKGRLRIYFASPSKETIRQEVATLAQTCHREFGVPACIANVARGADA